MVCKFDFAFMLTADREKTALPTYSKHIKKSYLRQVLDAYFQEISNEIKPQRPITVSNE